MRTLPRTLAALLLAVLLPTTAAARPRPLSVPAKQLHAAFADGGRKHLVVVCREQERARRLGDGARPARARRAMCMMPRMRPSS